MECYLTVTNFRYFGVEILALGNDTRGGRGVWMDADRHWRILLSNRGVSRTKPEGFSVLMSMVGLES
jgi:hypothetical protein